MKKKLIKGDGSYVTQGNTSTYRRTYIFALYLFGIPVYTMVIHGLSQSEAVAVFGQKVYEKATTIR